MRWDRVSRSRCTPLFLGALLLFSACDPREGPLASTNGNEVAEAPEVLDRITRPVDGGAVHLVRIVQGAGHYAFDPADLSIRPGDVVRFIMGGSQPESIVFDPVEATPEAGAYVRAHALHRGVLMTDAGQVYDVPFPDAPAGRYPFRSLPHAEQGMRGTVTVAEAP
jgi:plastocyanin